MLTPAVQKPAVQRRTGLRIALLGVVHAAVPLLRWLLAGALGTLVVLVLVAGGLAWRLAQGPLDLTPIVPHLASFAGPGLSAGRITVAMERGVKERLLRFEVDDAEQAAEAEQPAQTIHHAMILLPLSPLLIGRVTPEEIEAQGVRLHIVRSVPTKPARAEANARHLLSQLRRVAVSDVQVSVADGVLGQSWQVSGATAEAQRQPGGGVVGHVAAQVSIGGVSAQLQAEGTYSADGLQLSLTSSAVSPAALAQVLPQLSALSALDAAIGLRVQASFNPAMQPVRATVHAESGPGTAQLPAKGGPSPAKFDSLSLDADVTQVHATVQALRVVLRPPSGAAPTTVTLSGTADRANGRFLANLVVDLDHAAFADLPALWPERVGGNARTWLTTNITAGTAHDAHFAFTLTGKETGEDVDLTQAGGSLTGDDVTAWWLRPVPPLEHGHAVLVLQSPEALVITVSGARQGGLVVNSGSIRITGLNVKDQESVINADIAGPLGDLFTLLKNPRLKLLSAHPVPITNPAGAAAAHLTIDLPLETKVTIDQIAIHANGQVTNTHLGTVAAGRDLDQGQLNFDVTNDGMTVSGPGQFDHIPGNLALTMDFRGGPPTQVTTHAALALQATERDTKAAGLSAIGLNAGTMALSLDYQEQRNDDATIKVNADLKAAGLATQLGWSKPVGTAGFFEGQAVLSHGRLVGLEGLRAEAPGLSIQARSEMVGGVPDVIHLQRGDIGRSSATGTVALPRREGDPYRVVLSGPRLDLEGPLKAQNGPAAQGSGSRSATPYSVDLKFQQVIFGPGRSLGSVSLTARGDGRRLSAGKLVTGGPERFQAELATAGLERTLSATAADLGALLHVTGLASEITGGAMSLQGSFDDKLASSPFNGTIDLRNFDVKGAPVMGKVLQGMTLYGLVDALSGPGLVFDQFTSPFRLDGSVLDLGDARAHSSSLGVTATGQLDFDRKQVDLTGTIVPAYFFNSLPGRVPLLGRLFSPERGGGVFAATVRLKGSLLDPSVSINPLSALTPGFTRRFFDLFK